MGVPLIRSLKNATKQLLHGCFVTGQRVGWDILPRHFYSEIPDIRRLRRSNPWKAPYTMIGVEGADLDSQVAFLKSILTPAIVEQLTRGDVYRKACERNGESGFGQVEAECLYAFVHTLRPERIVQVGCGVSTAVCLNAAEHAGYRPEIVCVEPYPTGFLSEAATSGQITLIRSPVEAVPAHDLMSRLRSGDLFFVDSTHCLGPAGEVTRLILEFLPLLPSGGFAHFHDIYFPYDYSPDVLDSSLFFHHESPLLHAFLVGHRRFALAMAMSDLHHRASGLLREVLPHYEPCPFDQGLQVGEGHFPSSAYLLATADGVR